MLLKETEAAEYLNTTPGYLRVLRCRGTSPGGMPNPPYIKFGRSVRYHMDDLREYVDRHRVTPEGAR